MSDQEFNEKVIANLATIKANMKWFMAIGCCLIMLAGTATGTLWMRTEGNALEISTVQAAVIQHVKEVDH